MDNILPYVFLSGLAVAAIGLVGLMAAGFQERWAWGLGIVAFPPAGLVFALRHPRRSAWPASVMALGLALVAAPILYNRLVPIDLGPRERVVDGEVHLTLTGWDRKDYSILGRMPDVVVLQMANPDVDDAALRHVAGMSRLRELDLDGTAITDEGLRSLSGLERLESLRLRNTAISDAGFREVLAPMASLKRLDLTGTRVGRDSVREWREAKPGRRALQ